jgi:tRNA threonylcarbamoyl adenosine modification protein YjeE
MVTARETVDDRAAMLVLGRRIARVLAAGDLVVLTGVLGAGKTTLAQGIGAGLGVRGPITSPTFVIARVHPSQSGGPDLVHVDAYRLGSIAEVDDLDLDATLEDAVTVVEWGEGSSTTSAQTGSRSRSSARAAPGWLVRTATVTRVLTRPPTSRRRASSSCGASGRAGPT